MMKVFVNKGDRYWSIDSGAILAVCHVAGDNVPRDMFLWNTGNYYNSPKDASIDIDKLMEEVNNLPPDGVQSVVSDLYAIIAKGYSVGDEYDVTPSLEQLIIHRDETIAALIKYKQDK